jgi:hypothetical protein
MTIQKQKGGSVYRKGRLTAVVAGPLLMAALVSGPRAEQGVTVARGGDLQAAIDEARPGDVIRLEAGAVFTGNYVLRAKSGDDPITLRTSTQDRRLPSASRRIGPEHEDLLPVVSTPNSLPALRTEAGARHWRIMGLRVVGSGGGDLIALGDGSAAQDGYASVPEDIQLDRVMVVGDAARGQKRGIALNSGATTIRNCYIAGIKAVGQETQAIAGWNGPGPYLIENNYLEAAGIGVLFGGAEPFIGNLVPSDITVRRNTITRPLEWRDAAWTVKNLLELKNARRVLIEGNLLERNWSAAQVGFAILFTVRSSGPRAPWSTIEDVTLQHNIVRGVAGGINILGHDTQAVSRQARNILIRNNLFTDVDHASWGGNGVFLQVGEAPADITVEQNTILQSGNVVTAYGGTRSTPRPIHGFRFRNNIARHNQYGILGNAQGFGQPAIDVYFPDGEVSGNVFAGGPANRYPPGNVFPTVDDLMAQFVDPAGHNFRLRPGSWLLSTPAAGSVGVDYEALIEVMFGLGLH